MEHSQPSTSTTATASSFHTEVMARYMADAPPGTQPEYITLIRRLSESAATATTEILYLGEMTDSTGVELHEAAAATVDVVPLDLVDVLEISLIVAATAMWPDQPREAAEAATRVTVWFTPGFWDGSPEENGRSARFGMLANHLPAPIFLASANDRVTFTSYALDDMLGLIPGEAEQFVMSDLFGTPLALGKDNPTDIEISIGGSIRHLIVTVIPVTTDGETEYFGFVEDVSRERALQQMRDGVVRAVSHRLRTPLTGVIGYLDLLTSDQISPQEEPDVLQVVKREAIKLQQLVGDIVDFSKLTAGTAHLKREQMRLVSELDIVLNELETPTLEPSVDIPFDLKLLTDRNRLHQLLAILIRNAWSYGGDEVRVSARRRVTGVELVVSDNGRGISDAVAANMLSPFERATDHPDDREGGLGLAIVNGIMVAQGGTLTIEHHNGAVVTAWFATG